MELRDITKNLSKHKIIILFSILVGILAGVGVFFLPKTYTASGSFYVRRAADTVKYRYFSYEGYYAQQTGLSYTNTVQSLFESLDVRYAALNKLGIPANTENLRRYSNYIRAKKIGPQIITLTVTGKNIGQTRDLWQTVAGITIEKSKQINTLGDPLLGISRVSENPVVKDVYKPLWLCILSGALLAPILSVFYLTLKEYFRWK